jgi:hypothetical protein
MVTDVAVTPPDVTPLITGIGVKVVQRRRCPTCPRVLDKPVRMGSGSHILLEWNGTELLCVRGHGVMHVPENPAIWFGRPRWMSIG